MLDTPLLPPPPSAVIDLDAKADETWLVQSCLSQRPFAWQRFVDRFLPVVLKTVQEVDLQSTRNWHDAVQHELTQSVFQQLKDNDFQLLRDWDSSTDFETWLIVICRRVVLQEQTNESPGKESQAQKSQGGQASR